MSDDTSAFPLHLHGDYGKGMSLRDYFAAAALTGYFAAPHTPHFCKVESVAAYAYEMADAMIAARKEGA
jgi:hypothetical protein